MLVTYKIHNVCTFILHCVIFKSENFHMFVPLLCNHSNSAVKLIINIFNAAIGAPLATAEDLEEKEKHDVEPTKDGAISGNEIEVKTEEPKELTVSTILKHCQLVF